MGAARPARASGLSSAGPARYNPSARATSKAGGRAAQSAQAAYRTYAEQVSGAFRRGLAGEKTTSGDVSGGCNAVLDIK